MSMDKCREAFEKLPEIAERIERSKIEYITDRDFYFAPEWDGRSCSDQDFVNNFRKGWQSRQAEVEEKDKRIEAVEILLNTWKSFIQEQEFCGKPHKDTKRIEAMTNALEQALRGDDVINVTR